MWTDSQADSIHHSWQHRVYWPLPAKRTWSSISTSDKTPYKGNNQEVGPWTETHLWNSRPQIPKRSSSLSICLSTTAHPWCQVKQLPREFSLSLILNKASKGATSFHMGLCHHWIGPETSVCFTQSTPTVRDSPWPESHPPGTTAGPARFQGGESGVYISLAMHLPRGDVRPPVLAGPRSLPLTDTDWQDSTWECFSLSPPPPPSCSCT